MKTPAQAFAFPSSIRRTLRVLANLLVAVGLVTALRAEISFVEPIEICQGQPAVGLPDWVKNEVIYEINVRQYSTAGTFAAVEADLARIHDLGVRVLWFMPIHPIGKQNRKGELGSYYAVQDYTGINPEFGDLADWKHLVSTAQAMGFRIVMDWVANHTAWDHPWTQTHPEYYARNGDGSFVPPFGFDWTDVIQINFNNRGVWQAQIDAMKFWINETGVDGFRCDYATGVPTAFWNEVGAQLRAVKPDVFLLAEAEVPQHQLHAFNAAYSFGMMHVINDIAKGEKSAAAIDVELAKTATLFPAGSTLINYTTNHDENSWQGTVFERLGGGVQAFGVLTYLLDGIPLIYNGQEAGLDKRLEFFTRDPIEWRKHGLAVFYQTLNQLRRDNRALHTGSRFVRIPTTANDAIFAVLREAQGRGVLAWVNLTGKAVSFDLAHPEIAGEWMDVFSGKSETLARGISLTLEPWEFRILTGN